MKRFSTNPTRRDFIGRMLGGLGAAGMGGTMAQMSLMNQVYASTPACSDDGYKALVCIFLNGGNDANNMIVPLEVSAGGAASTGAGSSYAAYQNSRGILALPASELLPITDKVSNAAGGYDDSNEWAFHRALGDQFITEEGVASGKSIHSLFQDGRAAVVANVGTLVGPTTQSQFLSNGVEVPPQLFSHSDQSAQWQSSLCDQPFRTGWGGRIADMLNDCAGTPNVSMAMSMSGFGKLLIGENPSVGQYVANRGKIAAFIGNEQSLTSTGAYTDNLAGIMRRGFDIEYERPHAGILGESYRDLFNQTLSKTEFLGGVIAGETNINLFPNSSLGNQLSLVAKLISKRETIGQKRQIFFCSLGSWDTHSKHLESHAALLSELSQAVGVFYKELEALNVEDDVVSFTTSDFGRTYTPNGDDAVLSGSDHGWGSHALVVGGALNGRQIFGAMPNLTPGGPDDTSNDASTSRGRWIPTTSVDEYAAKLASWYGLSSEELNTVFPNLNRFSSTNLNFL